MGVIGKHGLLITDKEFGPSLRLAAVYTDIENLPVSDNNKHAWIDTFCDKCNRCVRECPVGAIYKQSKIFKDGSKQCIDYKKMCRSIFKEPRTVPYVSKSVFSLIKSYDKIKSGFLK